MKRKQKQDLFGKSLEKYVYLRTRVGGEGWVYAGGVVVAVMLLSSILGGYWRTAVLSGEKILIATEAAKQGDYRLARELLEEKERDAAGVLGVSTQLTELVYPKRRVEREIESRKEQLELYPGHKDILWSLAQLYRLAGEEVSAEEYYAMVKLLDPNGSGREK